MFTRSLVLSLLTVSILIGCDGGEVAPDDTPDTTDSTAGLPAGYEKFVEGVEVYEEGGFIVIETDAVPNHGSPYFATTDSRYEAYNGSNPQFRINPNRIAESPHTFRIPKSPSVSATHPATPAGAIGVALNGVPFFNQYAAGGSPLTGEINSFDQHNGHPQQTGIYHYHIEPLHLTATYGQAALLGFLLDGFPVYGPMENGVAVTNDDLDDYHGHTGPTAEYPSGIYHYHITAEDPYLNGAGFYGTPGTVTR